MGKLYDTIDDSLAAWIGRQRVFFVGTAPSGADGHVNVSPKGPIETLRVAGPRRIAYLDVVGSGAETIAHLRDNGRIVVMLCAFEGPPRIVRLHGRAEAVAAGDPRFDQLVGELGLAVDGPPERLRSLVVVDVERIADSCGFGVPLMQYEGERPQGVAWAETKLRKGGRDALREYVAQKNETSIDGLPALDVAS
jgi:Pyridoxamine 5'-phosphate oxidase